MGAFSAWHWLIVLVIVMLIFGTKKLRNIGSDLGGAVRGFKESMKEGETQTAEAEVAEPQKLEASASAEVVDAEPVKKSEKA